MTALDAMMEGAVWADNPDAQDIHHEILALEKTNPRKARQMLFEHPEVFRMRMDMAQHKEVLRTSMHNWMRKRAQ